MKQAERDAWNNRPTNCKTFTLCEGPCNQLTEDAEKRTVDVFGSIDGAYKWHKIKGIWCKECLKAKVAEARGSYSEQQW